jgi:predicted MFS family arabinose efflux permease
MQGALFLQCIGLFGFAFSSGWWSLVPLSILGLAISGFLPAQLAYVSDQAAFHRRGRAIASIETSFAFSGIIVLPIAGWVLDNWGWRVPFLILGLVSLLVAIGMHWLLPKSEERSGDQRVQGSTWVMLKFPHVRASMGVALLTFIAVSMFMTFWGIWLNQDFGLGAAEVGMMATIIGFSELSGAILSGLFIDRIGKRNGNMAGLLVAAIMFVCIPILGKTLGGVRVALVLTVLMIEFTVISLFPLYSEQAPNARATIFSLASVGNSVGFMIGPPLAASLWEWKGVVPIGLVGAISLLFALLLVWRYLFDNGSRQ